MLSNVSRFFFIFSAALFSFATSANARLIVVPRDYPTIQMAVDNADGEDIVVLPGVYQENVFVDHGVTLFAIRGATIIADVKDRPALRVYATSEPVTIAGFTVVSGLRDDAVEADGAGDVWIEKCTMEGPDAYFSGLHVLGGSWVHAEDVTVSSVTVSDSVCGVVLASCPGE